MRLMLEGALIAAMSLSLGGCSKYSSFLDCLNGELKDKYGDDAKVIAVKYCGAHYKITEADRRALGYQ